MKLSMIYMRCVSDALSMNYSQLQRASAILWSYLCIYCD